MDKNRRRRGGWWWLLLGVILFGGVVGLGMWVWLAQRAGPNKTYAQPPIVRAVRVDYLDMGQSRGQVAALETQMKQAGVNLVAIGVGRADWTYFPWAGHAESWSSEVRSSGIDFLGEDSRRFGQWAHVTAVVDVLGPRYIAAHPETAAIAWNGQPSQKLVGTLELVEGEYGRQVLALIETVAADYPVHSILLAELVYHVEGYGERDKAAYLAYAKRTDWPRTAAGEIDVADISLGEWRSYEVSRFVEQAAARVHAHGKQLFLEVRASPSDLTTQSASAGTRYDLMLNYADRLLAWDNAGLEGNAPERLQALTRFFSAYGPDRVIPLLGLWEQTEAAALLDKTQQRPVAPAALQASMEAVQQGGAASLWVAPSYLLTADHWAVLHRVWGASAAQP